MLRKLCVLNSKKIYFAILLSVSEMILTFLYGRVSLTHVFASGFLREIRDLIWRAMP